MRPLVPTLIEEFPAYRLHPDGTLESRFRLGRQPGMSLYTDKWRVRNLRPKESGYIGVHLGRPDGPSRRTHIHRLLAEVFIGPPPFPRACARHIDGNGFNNHALNIRWGSYAENEQDKKAHGTWHTRNSNAKLDLAQRNLVFQLYEAGQKHQEIADLLGVSRPTISRLLSGVTWRS